MKRGILKTCAVAAILFVASLVGAEEVQWVRATVLLETGFGKAPRVEETLVPGGVYSLEEVKRRGQGDIDIEILERIRRLGDGMSEVEQKMRLGTLLARQYYLKLEVGEIAVLPVIDLNPRLGIVIEPLEISDRAICKIKFNEPEGPPGTTEFTGEPITLALRDADLQDVLRVFSKVADISIEIDPSIEGSSTVELREVPWDQALDLLLRINGLGWERQGNILKVAPLEEMSARKRVRTEATVNLPREPGGSSMISSRGDEKNPTVVLMVESVDGPPELVAERDGLLYPKRIVLVSAQDGELESSLGKLAIFRGVVTEDGALRDVEVLASPSPGYAKRLLNVLRNWEFRAAFDEEGRRHEAVVGYGIRINPPLALVSISAVEHVGVEVKVEKTSPEYSADYPNSYTVEVYVSDLDTGKVISAPRILILKGDEGTIRMGFVAPSGEPSKFEMKILISEKKDHVRCFWTLTSDGKVVSSHKAEFDL